MYSREVAFALRRAGRRRKRRKGAPRSRWKALHSRVSVGAALLGVDVPKPLSCLGKAALVFGVSLTMTYFRTRIGHYHRRGLVSRSCSGWEGVVPRRYGRQTLKGNKGEEGDGVCARVRYAGVVGRVRDGLG